MVKWIDVRLEKPATSGEYNIKSTGLFKECKKCYYDATTNHWTFDDGFWLPVSLDLYVAHWCN